MPNFLASWQPSERRDAGAAERTGLENRSRGNSTGGSNPPLSATIQAVSTSSFSDQSLVEKILRENAFNICTISL